MNLTQEIRSLRAHNIENVAWQITMIDRCSKRTSRPDSVSIEDLLAMLWNSQLKKLVAVYLCRYNDACEGIGRDMSTKTQHEYRVWTEPIVKRQSATCPDRAFPANNTKPITGECVLLPAQQPALLIPWIAISDLHCEYYIGLINLPNLLEITPLHHNQLHWNELGAAWLSTQ